MIHQHQRIASAIALTVALGATFAPSAWADPAPLAQAEAAIAAKSHAVPTVRTNPDEQIAGTRQTSSPSLQPATVVRPNPDRQAPGVTPVDYASPKAPATIVHAIAPSGGFDWGDAAIGAGAALALIGVALVGTRVATGIRHHTRHQRAAASS